MSVDWGAVGTGVKTAVAKLVGAAWQNAAAGASTQFAAVIAAGQSIERNKDTMSQSDYNTLKIMQQRALDGVLQTYAGISLDIAQQAAAAAWNVVATALKTAYPALGFVL
jgi:hypothetical protein